MVSKKDEPQTLEDHIQSFISLEEEVWDRQWLQGGTVSTVRHLFGGDAVREMANKVRKSYSHLQRMAQTWERFRGPDSDSKESAVLSFSHHMAVCSAKYPEKWLAMAEDDNIDSKSLQSLQARNADIVDVEEGSGFTDYFDDHQWQTCPECRGRGKVPLEQEEEGPEPATAGRGTTVLPKLRVVGG